MYLAIAIIFLFISPLCQSRPPIRRDTDDTFLTDEYHNYKELKILFRKLEQKHRNLAKVRSLGKSVKGKDILVIEIHGNINNIQPLTPKFKYVANVYGNHAVGRQLLIYLAEYLLMNFGKDDRITQLVNKTDIFLIPSINPDGFEHSDEGECDRYLYVNNQNDVNLNTNFPDQVKGTQDSNLIQPETEAMMKFIQSNHFVLSGNLQGDGVGFDYPIVRAQADSCREGGPTSDSFIFMDLSQAYSSKYDTLMTRHNDACSESPSPSEDDDEEEEDEDEAEPEDEEEAAQDDEESESGSIDESESESEEETGPEAEEGGEPEGEEEGEAEGEEEGEAEGEQEVKPEGEREEEEESEEEDEEEGDEEAEGEGDDKSEGEGDDKSEGEGESDDKSEGEGDDKSEGEGDDKSEAGEGDKPTGEGDDKLEGGEQGKPEGEGIDKNDEEEEYDEDEGEEGGKPEGEAGEKPEGEEGGLPSVDEGGKPESEEGGKPEGEGDDISEGEGDDKSEGEGEDKSEGEGNDKDEGEEGDKPEGAEGELPVGEEGDKHEGEEGDKPEGEAGEKPEGEEGGKPEEEMENGTEGEHEGEGVDKPEEGEYEDEDKHKDEGEAKPEEGEGESKPEEGEGEGIPEEGKPEEDAGEGKPEGDKGEAAGAPGAGPGDTDASQNGDKPEGEEEEEEDEEEGDDEEDDDDEEEEEEEEDEEERKRRRKARNSDGTGMAEFNYFGYGCFEVTFWLSCCPYPEAIKLRSEWKENKEALISFIESAHWGIKGMVMNDAAEPVPNAVVIIDGNEHHMTTTPRGEYWRLLLPGTYKISVKANGYQTTKTEEIVVVEGQTTIRSFVLTQRKRSIGGAQIIKTAEKLIREALSDGYVFQHPSHFFVCIPSVLVVYVTRLYS